jgi:hypothetical protein
MCSRLKKEMWWYMQEQMSAWNGYSWKSIWAQVKKVSSPLTNVGGKERILEVSRWRLWWQRDVILNGLGFGIYSKHYNLTLGWGGSLTLDRREKKGEKKKKKNMDCNRLKWGSSAKPILSHVRITCPFDTLLF